MNEDDEDARSQLAQLHEAGVTPWSMVIDRTPRSGTVSPVLEQLLADISDDDVLVVTGLGVFGSSLDVVVHVGGELARRRARIQVLEPAVAPDGEGDRLLAALLLLADFQREREAEDSDRGPAPVAPEGKRGVGRPRRLNEEQAEEARRLHGDGVQVAQIARYFGVPRSTVYGHLSRK